MKYIPINSVLYSLSTLVDEKDWNDSYFLEWAIKASRKLNLIKSFVNKVCILDIVEHVAQLPIDCHEITMIAVNTNTLTSDENQQLINNILNLVPSNSSYKYLTDTSLVDRIKDLSFINRFVPMKKSTSPFLQASNVTSVLDDSTMCSYEYDFNPDGTLYCSIKNGKAILAYKGYPTTNEEWLIPDNEDVKEAIESFVLYRFFESKAITDPQSERQRDYYQNKFYRMSMKAKSLNLPTIDELENISNMNNRLKRPQHQYDKLFSSMGNKENIKFSSDDKY